MATYGELFSVPQQGDRKVVLNFAPILGFPIDVEYLRSYFDPEHFLIKLTPVNPTVRSRESMLLSAIDPSDCTTSDDLIKLFGKSGYDVLLSIGVLEENRIGINCGQFIQRALGRDQRPEQSYELERYSIQSPDDKK
jgi:23S rRNA (adenine2503-C2)-methyltransferase